LKLESLITFFSSSPSAKLLRAQNAPFIIYFLNVAFKVDGSLTLSHTSLQHRLRQFQEEIRTEHPDVLIDDASNYLTQWSTGDSRWLRRFYDSGSVDSVYQLTPHTEEILKFFYHILDQSLGFVGTESRLSRIIATLNDLVVRGSSDAERRLAFLYSEQKRLEEEIASVKAGEITTHSPTAIRERFVDAVTDLMSLQGDFRAVEESFKSITRDVQRKQGELSSTRGTILGFALDAEDRLKDDDQGASFQAFVRLILSQTQQESLERIIGQLDEMQELSELEEGKQRVRGMIRVLSAEAEKVLSTTRRLSNTLRRLLESQTNSSRLRLAQVLRDLKSVAASYSDHPPETGLEVSTEFHLNNVFARTFWEPPLAFDELAFTNEIDDEDQRLLAFRELAAMQRLDWERMRSNIQQQVDLHGKITLAELMKSYPAKSGSLELLGYIQLAHDDGHTVDESMTESVSICINEDQNNFKIFEVPRVTFHTGSSE
jgi:hypothetical protein